jgi:chromosomal replication initiation ATPase DnaA|tara:strand:+ start:1316 stop:1675 length:360 start_codon:yes stop_codon:yes gene_type:complete
MQLINELKQHIKTIYDTDLTNLSRKRHYVNGRIAFAKICRTYFKMGYTEIGRLLGKDHATVIHYIKIFDSVCQSDFEFRHNYEELESNFNHLKNKEDIENKIQLLEVKIMFLKKRLIAV